MDKLWFILIEIPDDNTISLFKNNQKLESKPFFSEEYMRNLNHEASYLLQKIKGVIVEQNRFCLIILNKINFRFYGEEFLIFLLVKWKKSEELIHISAYLDSICQKLLGEDEKKSQKFSQYLAFVIEEFFAKIIIIK